jgi:hypothetical protein
MGCHTSPPNPAAAVFEAGIPEICPPGEGTAPQIDKIFWMIEQAEVRLRPGPLAADCKSGG